jgi:hypothetical protein
MAPGNEVVIWHNWSFILHQVFYHYNSAADDTTMDSGRRSWIFKFSKMSNKFIECFGQEFSSFFG